MSPNAAVNVIAPPPALAPSDDDPTEQARRLIGTLIDGKYQLNDLLGVGTTGAVFRAQNRWAGRPCAVKLFHYQGPDDQSVLRRFLREAQAIHRVRRNNKLHPHVVDALDVGRDRETGRYFVVQELLRGETLSAYLQRLPGQRMSLPNALRILRPVIDAVACAHEGAVVHRDLKPDNILLTRGEDGIFPKVLDFGIAQITEERVTPVTEFMGTPLYMPPEAFGGASYVDARADVWALGVMLYEMLSGQNPFAHPSGDPMGCMELVIHRAPPSLAAQGLVPPTVWNVIRRAMAKPLSQRYLTARDLLDALDVAMRPVRMIRVTASMTREQVSAALCDPAQHASAPTSASEGRRTVPPPAERRTLPPPSMLTPSRMPAAVMAALTETLIPRARVSVVPGVAELDGDPEVFTGDPRDYWWSVVVQGSHAAEDIVALLRLHELAHVVELHISGCPLGDAGVATLVESPALRDLAALSLRRVGLTARGAAALAGAVTLANLLKLDLEANPLGDEGLRTILGGRHACNLRALCLVLAELGEGAAEALTDSTRLPALVRLDLSQNRLGDGGVLLLARYTKYSPDLWLSLSRNRVSPSAGEMVTALLASRVRKVVL